MCSTCNKLKQARTKLKGFNFKLFECCSNMLLVLYDCVSLYTMPITMASSIFWASNVLEFFVCFFFVKRKRRNVSLISNFCSLIMSENCVVQQRKQHQLLFQCYIIGHVLKQLIQAVTDCK